MNKLKQMVIDNMKKAHKESCFADKVFVIDYLMPQVNNLCDRIIDDLLQNGNVDMKASFDYDMKHQCPVLCFEIINNPISEKEIINSKIFIKNTELSNENKIKYKMDRIMSIEYALFEVENNDYKNKESIIKELIEEVNKLTEEINYIYSQND